MFRCRRVRRVRRLGLLVLCPRCSRRLVVCSLSFGLVVLVVVVVVVVVFSVEKTSTGLYQITNRNSFGNT